MKKTIKVKEPETYIIWPDRALYKIYKTRIVKTDIGRYRVDGCFKKWFGFKDFWVILCDSNYEKTKEFQKLEKAQQIQKEYISYYENILASESETNVVIEEDVVKTIKTHPQHFI